MAWDVFPFSTKQLPIQKINFPKKSFPDFAELQTAMIFSETEHFIDDYHFCDL